jgi:hypothetical protein
MTRLADAAYRWAPLTAIVTIAAVSFAVAAWAARTAGRTDDLGRLTP